MRFKKHQIFLFSITILFSILIAIFIISKHKAQDKTLTTVKQESSPSVPVSKFIISKHKAQDQTVTKVKQELPEYKAQLNERKNKSSSIKASNDILGDFTVQTLDSDGWIINESILQYATILSIRTDHQVEIEAMLWLYSTSKKNGRINTNSLKCAVVLNEHTGETVLTDVFELNLRSHSYHFSSENIIHFAKCMIDADQYKRVVDNKVIVSVIDLTEFQNGNIVLSGKQPLFFDRNLPREKSVLICACAMPNLKDDTYEHTITWAKINRLINVRSQIYTSDVTNNNMKRLKQEHSGLIDVFDYDLDLFVLCNRHMSGARFDDCMNMHNSLFNRTLTAYFHPFHEVYFILFYYVSIL
jgi:hypothetical protein